MRKTVSTLLLFICISQCLCEVTWISPLDGDTETLAENKALNSLIDTLNATSSNTIAYVMVSQTPSQDKFGIQNTNELYLKAGLDYEATKSYEVVIRALDSTANEEADITLNITVTDINDETPVITSDTVKDLSTKTIVDSVVFAVTSTDQDTVGTVTYSITGGNDRGDFSINATTGEITLITALNITVTPEYDLVIEATDGVNTATQTISFYVTDIIWQTPIDGLTDFKAENTSVDSTIITLNAENAFAYSFVVDPASEQSKFRIRNSHNLTLEQPLDYETTKSYTFTLKALGSSPSAVITYTVNVTDVNDEPPVFAAETVSLDLTKDTDIGTVVFTAEVTDPDTVGSPAFSIEGGNTNESFSINTTTGDITLDKALDPDNTEAYSLVIEVTDSVYTDTMTLSITVNKVVWTEPPKGTSEDLPEDTGINTVIKNLTAETATTYIVRSQTPDTGKFDIINTNELVLVSELDYETSTSHIISLRATDVSGKSADITYIVNVTDVNDLDPVLESGTFEVVPENTPVGSTIHTASATDGDTVGTLSYSITAGNDDGTFGIDSGTGNITLDSALIPNTTGDLTYNLIIEVTDSLHPVTQSLTINIKTVPVLVLPVNGTTITENVDTSGPLVVLVLDSTDLDNDQAPIYSIDSQSHPGTFSISDDNTELITIASFDRETVSEYNVTLRVTDRSEFDLSSAATLIVSIGDVNDAPPLFTSNSALDLADDTPASNTFIVYTATTDDPDITGTVTYSITAGDTNGDFNMNPNGSITLNNALNASITPTYTLSVVADDTANETPFNLTVKVVTEPQFAIPASGVELAEGSYTSHPVWTFSVTDVDGDTDPTFAILEQSVNGTFEISGNNTQLVTSATFDFENTSSYTITLQVVDFSSPLKRSSTAILTVNITDVNDELPAFNPASVQLELREDTAIGLVDYRAMALDPDSTSLTYSIVGGNTNDVFSMDADTGNLSLAKNLTSFEELRYDLIVQANDSINVGTQRVNVTVVTANDSLIVATQSEDVTALMGMTNDTSIVATPSVVIAPVFEFPGSVEVAENTNTGHLVLVLNSTDRDGDQNPQYEILSQSDPGSFELNADNTTLVTSAGFDYESKTSYNVTLKVTDTSPFSMSTTAILVISITDTNDNHPVFESNDTIEISEFTTEGSGVYNTVTSDVDTGSVVTYSLEDGNTNGAFNINATSGEITLATALEPNVTLTYILTLRANDSVQTTDFNLTINVKTAPTFVFPSTNITISEDVDTSNTYTVWTFTSTDLDQDTGVVYDIVSQSVNGTFDISADNANLTTNASFDFETTQMYTVTLRATDNSMYTLSSTATLTIYITDANDNPPEFTSVNTLDLPEFQENNTVVYQTETRDNDTVGTVSYSITAGNSDDVFSIDSASGNVTIIKALDPETTLIYTLTIQANDGVNTATLNLTVNVISVPAITPFQINITENSMTGEYEVWTLTSNDTDGDTDPVYSLVNQSDTDVFRINDGLTAVVTNTSFDYESKIQYTFVIQVMDNSSLQLSSSATFTVSIIDENDVTPNFTSSAAVDMLEDTAINSTVYTPVTVDPDTIGSVTYTIIAGNDNGIFGIDGVSGNITLEKALNASDTIIHVLRLQANDTRNAATFNLTLNVRTAPFMNIPDPVTVEENVAAGSDVLILASTDLDGDNNPVYELESQSVPGTFRITDNNTKLVTNDTIDYEAVQNFTVTVRVTEISDLNLTSTAEFTIQVVDANDKTPVFTSDNSTEVAENTAIGVAFYTAAATDEDTMTNLSFSIIDGNNGNVFSINPDNGSLSLQSALNVSTVNDLTYVIGIQVNDSLNTATLNLTVNVKTAPVIHVIDIYIPEDVNTTGTFSVWPINSTDLDGDKNATFAIVSQSEAGVFDISSDNEIVTSATFDFEMTKNYTVTLNATDSSQFKLFTTATLTMQITDANDNSPVFTSNTSLVVLETANTGDVLVNITTEDVDTVGNTTYSITDGNRNGDFAIGPSSGELTLVNKLDPQNLTDLVYNLIIMADDSIQAAYQNLTVNVKTAPLLTVGDVNIDENTNTSGPYVVQNITWSDLDNDQDPTIEIAVESVPGTFQLVNVSVLVTNAEFDYENTTQYTVTLRIIDVHGLSYNDTLTVMVLDVNDMPPVFVGAPSRDISEKTTNGSVAYTANATDPDTNPTIEYSITDGNTDGFFSINAADGTVTLVKEFNSTTSLEFNLTLQANDTANIGELNLTINVITVPVINTYQINITENTVPGVVWNLTSSDRDGNVDPAYVLVNQSDVGVFGINDTRTAVTTNTSFDFESQTMYTFEIQVMDNSSLKLSSSATFTVSIIDENDVSPNFTSSAAADVLEDAAINTTVYTAVAEDPDTQGFVMYSIIDGNNDGIFVINEYTGIVTLNKTLNASDTVTHVLLLRAYDSVNEATFNVTLNVRTAPFMNIPDPVMVEENVNIGSDVLILASTDLDGDENPVYELESQSVPGTFRITDNNTKLVTNASIDYESEQNFTVIIRVTEISDLNLTSTAEFTVHVVDLNDRSPVFTSANSTEVAENTAIGGEIYIAVATDEDTMGNLSYSIIDGDPNNVFSINPENGSVVLLSALSPSNVEDLTYILGIQANDSMNTARLNVTVNVKTAPVIHVTDISLREDVNTTGTYPVWTINATDLDGDKNATFAIVSQSHPPTFDISNNMLVTDAGFDFENTTSYTVVINVTDTSSFKLWSQATLIINITDVNDMTPSFTSNISLVALETANIGDVLLNITVDDADTVGSVTFSITDGNRNSDFAIGPTSGELTLVNKLDPQNLTDLVYDLIIMANDSIQAAYQNLTVNVKTVPSLSLIDVNIQENTNTSGPYVVQNITWSDLDNDENPTIEIAVESVPGTFQLVNDSVLVTSAEFDYENTTQYTVTLRIIDVHGLSYNDTLTVMVLDVNDMPPVFVGAPSRDISEKTTNASVVYTANATDPDTSPTIEYSITDGNTDGFFSINAADGTVTLVKEFNSTTSLEFNLTLQANDTANIGELNLTINVITVPVIDAYQINITENSVPGIVWNLTSTDRDGNIDPVYVLVNQSDVGVFEINDARTAVITNTSFDFESKTMYTFEIQVTDNSSLQLSSAAIFTVSIVDENDVTPAFNSSAAVQLEEDTALNTTVYVAETIDQDTIGTTTYSIIGGNDDNLFEIDAVSGNVTLVKALNATATLRHVLTLQANDTENVAEFNVTFTLGTVPVLVIPDNVTVVEGVAIGSPVLTLVSTDLDNDTDPVYEIINQNVPGTFKLNENNTILVTNATIDYESLKNVTVTLRVTDTSKFNKSSTSEFTVSVVDTNDESPVFISGNSTDVPETAENDTVIYTAVTTDVDTIGGASYSIIGGDPGGVFDIDADNGSLTVQTELSPTTVDDVTYKLVLQVNDSVNTATLNLTVNVKAAPVIHVVDIDLPENVNTTGTYTVWTINATDLNREENITFAIVSQSDPGTFEINGDGAIVTTATFDFETTKNYTIVINATDSSLFMLWSIATVTISITDVNDVTPTFTSNTSPIVVLVTTSPGTVLYNTTTDDIDTVGMVTYNITDGNRNDDFSIEPYTGQLTLQNKLDPQVASDLVYGLVIEADDGVNTAYLNLTVDVKTVPYLNVTDMNVTENTDTSGLYHVWTIGWTDLDGDVNPTFEIIGESIPDTFYIVNSVLVTNATLDYETVKNYTATISITDVRGLSSNATLTLFVLDENDVTPNFTSNPTLDLWEKTNTGEGVYTVATVDQDTVGTTKYSLTDGNTDTRFDLDADTGELTLINALDFARTSSYNLRFSANDSENVAFFNFTVNVKTSPVINFTGVNVEISEGEDTSGFFVLLNLTSTDPDNDPNPQYDIVAESTPGTFVINGDKLQTNASFDFEVLRQYFVNIRVTDSSLGLTSNDTLMVSVTDVNDNAPRILFPIQPLEYREDTPIGSVVFVVIAVDSDTVSNVSLSITGGDTNNDFSIDAVTGNVTLSNAFNASAQIQYNLGIEASDGFLTDTKTVEINIKTAPVLVFPDTNVTIPEDTDTSGNYSVWTLQSSDLDSDTNPRYELVSQSVAGTFFLSDDNTELLTAAELNYTAVTMYEVTLRVIDSSLFEMTSTGTLTVYITDVNNLRPKFTSPPTLEIPENQATGSVVYTAAAIDTDTVGELSYSILQGNINDVFSLDAQSGNLTLVNALTPSALLQYVLKLQANDTINTVILQLTVDVKTIPAIVVPDDNLTIVETADTSGPYVLLELTSTDLDNDSNPVYTIISQTVNDTFEITNGTLLTTTATFDYETRNTYEILVQVTDTSDLSSSATFAVLILNADDEAPVFTSGTEKYLSEKEKPGIVVYTAMTYDNDTSGSITYSIIGGNSDDDFSMDSASGDITLVNELRPREVVKYNLQLQASDSLNQGYLNLTVNVVTVPEILFPAEPVTIVENTDMSNGYVWICASQDFDGDKNPVYSIVSQSVNGTFELNDDKTRLITKASFDYEETQSYEIVIGVTDTSPLELSSTATLSVFIEDVNDVKPNFTSPTLVEILENEVPGTVVYTVVTEDPDTVGNVTYKFTDGNTNSDFSIDGASGNITVVNVLNVSAIANYSLVIQANDTANVASLTLLVELKPDINECEPDPCKNSASCVDGKLMFTCECARGYDGVTCENDIDECATDPCLNGATCQHGIDEYNCTCADGFSGDNCEIDDDECQSSPCQNGTCLDLVNGYNCTCSPGYEGVNCETDIDECVSGPCQNNGTCTDAVNGYTCSCAGGYNGDNCENEIDECESVVCTNNGTCFDLVNDFNCTCQPGYTGQFCEQDIKECNSNPCQNSVTCVDNVNGYTCICSPGYTGDNCETDVDDCGTSPCANGGTCVDGVNSFSCNCSAGYTGPTCQNQCAANTFGIGCSQNCACNDAGIISCNHVNGSCNCNAFYEGDRCETEIDECNNASLCNNTNEGCDNIVGGGYNCSCYSGFERNATSGECDIATTVVTTTPVPATKVKVSVKLVMDLTLPGTVDLRVSATFQRYAVEVEFQLRIIYSRRFGLSVSFSIIIRSLRKGSLDVEYDVIVDETEAPKVALANADIASDTTGIPIFNETALPTAMTVNEGTVPVGEPLTDAVACQVYEATVGSCTGDYVCAVKDGSPGCQLKDTEDNLPLILGLGIGIPAFFVALAVIVLCVAYYNNKTKFLRRKYRDDYDDRSNEMYDRKLPVRANTGPPTWPFIASPEHAEYQHYADYSREGAQRYLPSEDFQGQYDNQVPQDRDSNNYTWDYLFTHMRPGEPYHIRRPKFDYK